MVHNKALAKSKLSGEAAALSLIRPNIVWWNNKDQSVCLVELTVCHDTLFHEAARQIPEPPFCYVFGMQGTTQGWSQLKWDHEISQTCVGWEKNWNWQKLRLVTLWSKQLGQQCWAHLVYGAVETEFINSKWCVQCCCRTFWPVDLGLLHPSHWFVYVYPMKTHTHTHTRERERDLKEEGWVLK